MKVRNGFILIIVIMLLLGSVTNGSSQNFKNTNTCYIAKNIYNYYKILNSDSIKYVITKGSDECNYLLIDSLCSLFLKETDGRRIFNILSNVANNSDGYLSDYLVEKIIKIYYKRFDTFFKFLYENHENGNKNKLEIYLVESWSSIASLSDNPNISINKIRAKTKKDISVNLVHDSLNQVKYLNFLLNKINPKYLD